MPLVLCHSRRALRALLAVAIRSRHIAGVAGDLDTIITAGAVAARAIERADPPGPGACRIQRIETGELDVELGAGVVVERGKRAARRCIPFAVDIAGLAADP